MNKPSSLILIMLVFTVILASCAPQSVNSSPTAPAPAAPAAAAETETVQPIPTPTLTPEMPVTGKETTPAASEVSETSAPTGEKIVFTLSPGEGKARYRVREQLVNLSLPNDAVGETDQISGSVTILADGTLDSATSRFEVDLSTLVSDQSRRDNYLRTNVLQTNQFPKAVFVPKRVDRLTLPPVADGDLQFQLVGDLTLSDVTREVTWEVTGTLQNG